MSIWWNFGLAPCSATLSLITLTPAVVCYLRGEISFGNMHIRLGTPGYMGLGLLILQFFQELSFLLCCQFFY